MKTKLFLATIAFVAFSGMAIAQNRGNQNCNGTGQGRNNGSSFVDTNKDGVCDNLKNGAGNKNGKRDGTGQKNRKADGTGKGRNFVDTNKDGVCDNFSTVVKSTKK